MTGLRSAHPSKSLLLGLLVSLAGFSACGWHAGLAAPEGARSVGIEVFETRRGLQERGLEPLLSDALSKAVVDLVDLPLKSPDQADVVVRGTILEYQRRAGIRSPGNRLQETGILVSITAELIDRRSGEILVPSLQRRIWSGIPVDDRVQDSERAARRRAMRQLAETLVLDLFGGREPGRAQESSVLAEDSGASYETGPGGTPAPVRRAPSSPR